MGETLIRIEEVAPEAPDLVDLFARHLTFTRATSPACSVHSMEAADLAEAGVRFFVMRDGGTPVAMGALKALSPEHGEIKSMHVVQEARGRGHARRILDLLLEVARADRMTRVSLETGSQGPFEPARKLYAKAGFAICPPFGTYAEDPNSVFMTRTL